MNATPYDRHITADCWIGPNPWDADESDLARRAGDVPTRDYMTIENAEALAEPAPALPPHLTDLQPGEYVAARLAVGDIEGAELTAAFQYREGLLAATYDVPFADFRPTNWQRGWCDGYVLAELGPMFAARAL